jgi:hypothetical protein
MKGHMAVIRNFDKESWREKYKHLFVWHFGQVKLWNCSNTKLKSFGGNCDGDFDPVVQNARRLLRLHSLF